MPTALAVMAHPDDIEFSCAGTLALLAAAGWEIHMATMTAGDLGSTSLPRDEISSIRRREATESAAVLGASYTCLGLDDLTIVLGEQVKRTATGLIRRLRPDVVFTHSPVDYMTDHEETARIVREAAFASTIRNWKASLHGEDVPAGGRIPVLLHADPAGLVDHAGGRVPAGQVVDVTAVIGTKERMLACHASQREWMDAQHGEGDYIATMKRWSAERAKDFGDPAVRYAEGFRQHLAHGFPRDDVLTGALGNARVKTPS